MDSSIHHCNAKWPGHSTKITKKSLSVSHVSTLSSDAIWSTAASIPLRLVLQLMQRLTCGNPDRNLRKPVMVLFSLVWAFVCPVQYLFNGLIELTDMIHARVKETRIFMENRPLLIDCRLIIQADTDSTHIDQRNTDSTVENAAQQHSHLTLGGTSP